MFKNELTLFSQFSCDNCSENIEESEIYFQLESKSPYYWCEHCDYCHSFSDKVRATYVLIKENGGITENRVTVDKNLPKFSKRTSPLRYPGGKSKMIEDFYSRLDLNKTDTLVSPYIGGGSIEFEMLRSGVFEKLIINDLDWDLYNFYQVVFNQTDELIDLISSTVVDKSIYNLAHNLIVSGQLKNSLHSNAIKAFYYLINNRCSFSGIYNGGMQGGKSGKGLLDRYNPKGLIKRISELSKLSDRVTILNQDALEVIEEYSWLKNVTFLIDPPYIDKGQQLYRLNYSELHQHEELFELLSSFNHEFPNADYIVYYDDSKSFSQIGYLPKDQEIVGRKYSIAGA